MLDCYNVSFLTVQFGSPYFNDAYDEWTVSGRNITGHVSLPAFFQEMVQVLYCDFYLAPRLRGPVCQGVALLMKCGRSDDTVTPLNENMNQVTTEVSLKTIF